MCLPQSLSALNSLSLISPCSLLGFSHLTSRGFRLATGWVMCFWFGGGALFKRSLPGKKRTAKRGLRDLSWVKEGAWEQQTTFRTSVCWPAPAMWGERAAEDRRGEEGRGGDPLLHQSQKRKARAGVKRSVLHDLEDVPESAGARGKATPSDLFIRFD